eukprot:7453149-Alexandrium_andersonii.AAC.1
MAMLNPVDLSGSAPPVPQSQPVVLSPSIFPQPPSQAAVAAVLAQPPQAQTLPAVASVAVPQTVIDLTTQPDINMARPGTVAPPATTLTWYFDGESKVGYGPFVDWRVDQMAASDNPD